MAQTATHLVGRVIPWVPHAAMSRVGPNLVPLLASGFKGADRKGPYHYSHHYDAVFLERVDLDRTGQGLMPRFVKVAPSQRC